jgi:hypothetical protein
MNDVAVSVIIATYNYSSVLRYAIATVLWQTFRDFELIVVGDCCTDDSEEVVREFADPRVRWLNLAENSGSKSLPQNAGIEIARGHYIAYLAHDDLWHPTHLATVFESMERSAADLVHTVAVYVPPPGTTERHVSGIFPEPFRAGYVLVHSSVLHRRSLTEEIGPWPDHRLTQVPSDHLFWIRAAEAGKRFVSVPKLTVWKFNASSRPGCYLEQCCDEQARYFALIRDDPGLAERELLDVIRSAMVHGIKPLETSKVGHDAPPGGHIHFLRQIRGLEPMEPMPVIETLPGEQRFCIDLADDVPRVLGCGEALEMEVRIHNESDLSLNSHGAHPIHFAYHWLHADGSVAVRDGVRTPLIPELPPRSSLHYVVRIEGPSEAGFYQLRLALVQEGVRWFDEAAEDTDLVFEVRRR